MGIRSKPEFIPNNLLIISCRHQDFCIILGSLFRTRISEWNPVCNRGIKFLLFMTPWSRKWSCGPRTDRPQNLKWEVRLKIIRFWAYLQIFFSWEIFWKIKNFRQVSMTPVLFKNMRQICWKKTMRFTLKILRRRWLQKFQDRKFRIFLKS